MLNAQETDRMKNVGDEYWGFQSEKVEADIDEDTDVINYLFEIPSLQSIAIGSIAVCLWTHSDMKRDIEKIFYNPRHYSTNMKRLEEKSLKKLNEILLPDSLKLKISHYFQPIKTELFKCHTKYKDVYDLLKVGDFLQWTTIGTIDIGKSLKKLIDSNERHRVSEDDLYRFACRYCLEDSIPELFSKLPDKKMISLERTNYKYHIVVYWNFALRNQLPKLLNKLIHSDYLRIYKSRLNLYQNMVTLSIYTGNKYALNYFWPKMTEHEKTDNVEKWLKFYFKWLLMPPFKYQYSSEKVDILCFLLSQLNDADRQKHCFRNNSLVILKFLFFVRPYQRFFLPTIDTMMDYMGEDVFLEVTSDIFSQINEESTTNELLRQVWNLSPLELKKMWFLHAVKYIASPIGRLISVGDCETAFMILKDASYYEKKQLIFNDMNKLISDIFSSGRINLLDEVLSKTLSTDDIKILKHDIATKCAHTLFVHFTRKGKFHLAKDFLNWCYQSSEKMMNIFKSNEIKPDEFYSDLIFHSDNETYNQFMKWFLKFKKRISKFKLSFLRKFSSQIEKEILYLCDHYALCRLCKRKCNFKSAWMLFENLVNYNNINALTPIQISEFKNIFLKSVIPLLKAGEFEFASHLVNWCFNSLAEVNQFKNKLINSDRGRELLMEDINPEYSFWAAKSDFIKWFSPLSSITVKELKKSLLNNKLCKKYDKQSLLASLNFLVTKYNSSGCVNETELIHNMSNVDVKDDRRNLPLSNDERSFSDSGDKENCVIDSDGSYLDSDCDNESYLDSDLDSDDDNVSYPSSDESYSCSISIDSYSDSISIGSNESYLDSDEDI